MNYRRTTYYKDAAFWWTFTWQKWWKGISFHTKKGTTLRIFLWAIDYRTYNTKSPLICRDWRFPPERKCTESGDD
jgi:hypothetical protein